MRWLRLHHLHMLNEEEAFDGGLPAGPGAALAAALLLAAEPKLKTEALPDDIPAMRKRTGVPEVATRGGKDMQIEIPAHKCGPK